MSLLRERFPFRQWLEGGGDFLGSVLKQLEDFSIVQSQSAYADGMDKVATRRSASTDAIAIPAWRGKKLRIDEPERSLVSNSDQA